MSARQQLSVSPTRLPYHPTLGERYGVDEASWRALVDAIWPSAQTAEGVMLALSYCHAKQMDPFKRVVHIVPVWSSEQKRYVEGVWPGIASHRIEASRTKGYAGADPTAFGPKNDLKFWHRPKKGEDKEVTVKAPEWAQMTVYRMIEGQRCSFPGPRVYFDEFYARESRFSDCPNERWRTSPSYMLEKCAEAAALRKAFPEALGGELTAEEMEARTGQEMRNITPPEPPKRADFAAEQEAQDAHMADIAHGGEPEPASEPMGEVKSEDDATTQSGQDEGDAAPAQPESSASPTSHKPSPAEAFVTRAMGAYASAPTGIAISDFKTENRGHYEALSDDQQATLKQAESARRKKLKAGAG